MIAHSSLAEAVKGTVPPVGYRADIDGLRAIAVTSVVFYHAGLWPLTSGYVGVDIFFVISGFLIGGILFRECEAGHFSYARFYARRAKRILPALFAVTIMVCAVALLLMGARELRQTGISAASALVGISNIYFWWSTNYFNPSAHLNPFLMTWSLGVEEQFYIFFPLLLIPLVRRSRTVVLSVLATLTLVSFAVCVWVTSFNPTAAFYLLPMRAWELGCGVLLAVALAGRTAEASSPVLHNVAATAGLAVVLLSCVLFNDATAFPGWVAALPVLGTVGLIYGERSWINRRLLAAAPMVGIGLISYSWYLWHAPMMALTRIVHFGHPSVGLMCAVGVLSGVVAWLSWRYVEQPFRRLPLPNALVLRRYGVALLVVTALPASLFLLNGVPQRLDAHARAVERTLTEGRGNPCLVSYGVTEPSTLPGCRTAEGGARRVVALIGDSHAGALGPALKEIAAARGIGLVQLQKSSCAPLLGATRDMPRYPLHASECAGFNEKVFGIVAADARIDTVILTGFWGGSFQGNPLDGTLVAGTASDGRGGSQGELLASALRQTIARYRAAGKQVVVMADVPLLAFDPGLRTITEVMPVRSWLSALAGTPSGVTDGRVTAEWLRPSTAADAIVRSVALSSPGVRFHDPRSGLCTPAGCAYRGELPYYIDFQHLSRPGAMQALSTLPL